MEGCDRGRESEDVRPSPGTSHAAELGSVEGCDGCRESEDVRPFGGTSHAHAAEPGSAPTDHVALFLHALVQDHFRLDMFGQVVSPKCARIDARADMITLRKAPSACARVIGTGSSMVAFVSCLHLIHRCEPASTAASLLLRWSSCPVALLRFGVVFGSGQAMHDG